MLLRTKQATMRAKNRRNTSNILLNKQLQNTLILSVFATDCQFIDKYRKHSEVFVKKKDD